MLEYLMLKVHQQDWHGVADAAMDLREIEVKMKNPTKDKQNIKTIKELP